jgi:hypothetical protein
MPHEGRFIVIGTPGEIKRSQVPRGQKFLNASLSHQLAGSVGMQTPAPMPHRRSG